MTRHDPVLGHDVHDESLARLIAVGAWIVLAIVALIVLL